MSRARILLADDNKLFRDGLASLIQAQPDMEVVGRAEDGLEAYTLARELKPDLIIMDINMPISDGLEATQLIRQSLPEAIILILTIYAEEAKLFEALTAGAVGYMRKDVSTESFLTGIRSAVAGEAVLSRKLARQVLEEFARVASQSPSSQEKDLIPILTARELEVLKLIIAGATNKEISEQLKISLNTTKSHTRKILSKLHATSRQQAAQVARRLGLIHRY